MTFRSLLYAYIFGGLTFIPLLLAAIIIPAWLLLPQVNNADSVERQKKDDGEKQLDKKKQPRKEDVTDAEGAEGTFAVLRRYDFQAAHAALSARNGGANASGGVAAGTGTVDGGSGAETAANGSESVYQSMYRSVFDRSKGTAPSSVLETKDAAGEAGSPPNGRAKRKPTTTPANVFYIVLRHGHLMLYDSSAQLEVRHVISLAHHTVSISAGGSPEETSMVREGDLFIRRTAILLAPTELPNGHLQSRTVASKPFYLFSAITSEKENFYHALLSTRSSPPIPRPLRPEDMIKLQSTLHSSSLTPETRALNAFVSRIFLALYNTERAKSFVQNKIERKIARVQKPAFLASLALQAIDLGDAAPVISNLRLKDLNIEGDMTLALDVRYTGSLKVTISAIAKLDLGSRFKTRTADLVLATSLQRLTGHVLVRVKPPPSNRIWFCFDGAPEMEIKIEPVVSQRQITYAFVLRAIEERIRAVVAETLVRPNWDDVPFFNTQGQKVRGGLWADEGLEVGGIGKGAEVLGERNEKTMSMPALPTDAATDDTSATSSGSETTTKLSARPSTVHASEPGAGELKRRSVASLPTQFSTPPLGASSISDRRLAAPPKPLRSPSASTPSLKLDESAANMDPARGEEAKQDMPPQQRKWRIRNATSQIPTRREAVDAMRALNTSATQSQEREVESAQEAEDQSIETTTPVSPSSPTRTNSDFRKTMRTNSTLSTSTTGSAASGGSAQTAQQRRQNFLLAAGAATNAARNWSWNALANAKKNSPIMRNSSGSAATPAASAASTSGGEKAAPQEPMGRGQPLPPPGVPLPGPNRGLFGGLAGSVKRKPVLPARRATLAEEEKAEREAKGSEEFGPWRENSGVGLDDGMKLDREGDASVESIGEKEREGSVSVGKKIPPPLPKRRNTTKVFESSEMEATTSPVDSTGANLDQTTPDSTSVPLESRVPPILIEESGLVGHASKPPADNHPERDDLEDIVAIPAPIVEEEGDSNSVGAPRDEAAGLDSLTTTVQARDDKEASSGKDASHTIPGEQGREQVQDSSEEAEELSDSEKSHRPRDTAEN